jgi:transcriptional regulator with XRE-family HTH domain
MKTLSERLRYARESANLTQSELARAVRVSPSAINQIEKGGTKSLKAPTALAIERVTGISAEWLMSGVGDPSSGSAMPGSRDEQLRRILEKLEQLPQEHRDKVEAEVRFLASLRSQD